MTAISSPPRFFNTLSGEIEPLAPIAPPEVKLYTCGPTVYNHAHIGNFRAYVFEDLLQRHLEAKGYAVRRVMNLTDVDDKTIRGARQAAIPLTKFTAPFKEAFFQDLDTLRIKRAQHFPSATDHIAGMIAMIQGLLDKGIAYQADDRSIYFRLSRFPSYGKLAHLDLSSLRPGVRVRSDEYEKESVGDFALWKAWDEDDGDIAWDAPWGRGRPGWHIECSAMAMALLGEQLDIHCGGVDNKFPHHEAEIAQTESLTGKPFVRLWMHNAHLMVEGQKMAKSAGNFYTLRDLLDKGWTGREVRYALISVHYRLPLNFTFEGLAAARQALARLDEWTCRLTDLAGALSTTPSAAPESDAFEAALDDDLNISAALAHVFETLRESNRLMDAGTFSPEDARTTLDRIARWNTVLALEPEASIVPAEVTALLKARTAARAAKDWKQSDALRDQIAAMGWTVKDTKDGQRISKS